MPELVAPDDVEQYRAQFAETGYLVLPRHFTEAEIDAVTEGTNATLRSHAMEIVVDNLLDGERTFYGLARNREAQQLKINDLYLGVGEVRELALEPRLSALLRALLKGMRPVLCNTLTLIKGSGQPVHIDSLFMTPQTPHHLVAGWIAFEDVDPAAGPLVYYPGSHQIPLYRFRDGSHHASNEELPAWNDYIQREIEQRGLEKKIFLARKGDVFIWHSDLAHGGVAIQDPRKTRRSLVCHYFTEPDARKMADWRLDPLHDGFWFNRLPPAVRPSPDRFNDLHPFPEESYLRRNPDLREPLADGRITSGFAHYRSHGYVEGREI
jgi:ectoine hydroxylase-related dioxygenase (phytanoyl-CoA dioxygenase family)